MSETGWKLVLDRAYDFGDWAEAGTRGVILHAQMEYDGRRFPVKFFDPDRLHDAAEVGTEHGEAYYEPNVIMVHAISETAVAAAFERLAKAGEFDWLLG